MMNLITIGNLAADAKVIKIGNDDFVSFRIGASRKYTDDDGVIHETTQWVSVLRRGDGGGLTPYLKKGTKVFVSGNVEIKPYRGSDGEYYVSTQVMAREIELCGGKKE